MTTSLRDEHWMAKALELAQLAAERGEVPVGAVVVDSEDQLIGEGWNQPISAVDPSAHAEIVALRQAAKNAGNYRLPGATLYVTIEPCTMCAGALVHSRIGRLVVGALEPKAGAIVSQSRVLDGDCHNHRVEYVTGVLDAQASQIMSGFFRQRRAEKKGN